MPDDLQDSSEKTEEPTDRRLQEAVKKGNVINSREVTSFLLLFFLFMTVSWLAPFLMKKTATLLAPFITSPHDMLMSDGGLGRILWGVISKSALILLLPVLGTVIVSIVAALLQHGWLVTTDPIMPKLDRISLLAGLKRLVSLRALMDFIKGLLKIIIVGVVGFMVIYPELPHLVELPQEDLDDILGLLAFLAFRILLATSIIMAVIAVLDYMYQRYEYYKNLRMSRQELKEEFKQTEGDPVIKERLRSIRRERARKRMMAAVPNADVIITNPTHFAVALQYDEDTMRAPVVVAKGQDQIALNIRSVAEEHGVPVVENPPLARALHASCEIDEEIPLEHYRAVAQVIGYVYKLKGKTKRA